MSSRFIETIFLSRENRFITKVNIGGKIDYAHLPNIGWCQELLIKGIKVILEEKNNPNRKTRYTLHYVENKGVYVNLISITANKVVYNSLRNNRIAEIKDPLDIKKEVTFGNSRIDLFCLSQGLKTYVDVNWVTLI